MLQLSAAPGGQLKFFTRAMMLAAAALMLSCGVTRAVASNSMPLVETVPALMSRVTMTPLTRSGTLAW